MCNCKETMNKYSIYMLNTNNNESVDLVETLCDVFNYNFSQAEHAIKFTKNNGRCLIYNDESSKVIDAFHKIPVALKQHFQVVNDN